MDARREGGLGIYFYTNLMDSVSYRRSDDGQNILSMNKTYTI
ncbi:MAG: ATP-binding protein [Bacteroidaceae bacterium]|nr:ATP-binding protein [Bacteroidaceae bacterium]